MPYPVISLKPSYNSIIRGCPGVPQTLPRIECELRIRSNDGRPIIIDRIEVLLKTSEVLHSSAPAFTSKARLEKDIIHYKRSIRLSDKKIIGIDIPLTIALPDDIKDTNYNKFGYTFTSFECTVLYFPKTEKLPTPNATMNTESFATVVNVEKYNLFASPSLFPPLRRKFLSPDRKFKIKYCIQNPCLTTDDLLRIKLNIMPNLSRNYASSYSNKLFNKKVKLKSIVFDVKEVLEVYDSHADVKENTLQSLIKPFNTTINDAGIEVTSDIRIYTKNVYFKEFERCMNEPAVMFQLPHHEPNLEAPIPETVLLKGKSKNVHAFQYHCSITSRGQLFSITHGLSIKFKISNGKDFEIYQPLDVSAWPKVDISLVEKVIAHETEVAMHAKNFYDSFGGIRRNRTTGALEYPPLPPVVYTADKNTLKHVGVMYNMDNKYSHKIPLIE
ncbi:AaceriADR042Wp [[Ashbya] aceris (nom. inval.)]|nr:AaceriADR042Wp [[Ashbya] aceris (nom. inval.)]